MNSSELQNKAHELLKYRRGYRPQMVEEFIKKYRPLKTEIQQIILQTQLLRYYSNHNDEIPKDKKFSDIYMNSKKAPSRFSQKFPQNLGQIFGQWTALLISRPESFAKATAAYFTLDASDIEIFSRLTFPNIFFHFASDEFAKQASIYIETLLDNMSSDLFSDFFIGYFLNCPKFCNSIWTLFDQNMSRYTNKTHISYIFNSLIETLKVCASALTEGHHRIVKKFFEKDRATFANAFVNGILKTLYQDYIANNATKEEDDKNAVFSLFDFLVNHPNLPHIKYIVQSFEKSKGPKWVPPHAIMSDDLKADLIFSCRECFIVEDIIRQHHDILKITLIKGVSLDHKKCSDIDVVFIQISVHTFIKPCKSFTGNIYFDQTDPIKNADDEVLSRFYKQLLHVSQEEGIDSIEVKELGDNNTKLKPFINYLNRPNFMNYVLIESINMSNDSFSKFEKYGIHAFVHKEYLHDHQEAIQMYSQILQIVSQNVLEKPNEQVSFNQNDPALFHQVSKVHKKSSLMRRLAITQPSQIQTNVQSNEPVLTTAIFQKDMKQFCKGINPSNFDINANASSDYEVQESKFDQLNIGEKKGAVGKASEFILDFEDDIPVVEEVKPVKRKRRNSAEYERGQSSHVVKNNINQLIQKVVNPTELHFWLLLKTIDQWQSSTDPKLEKLLPQFAESVQRMKIHTQNKLTLPTTILHSLETIAHHLDKYDSLLIGTQTYHVLHTLLDLMQIADFYKTQNHSLPPNDVDKFIFNTLLGMLETNIVINTYVWYGKILFSFSSSKRMIPTKLIAAASYLEKQFNQFLSEYCDDSLSYTISECRQSL